MFLMILTSVWGCQSSSSPHHDDGAEGDTIQMAYARLLVLVQHPQYTLAEVRNPWDSTRLLNR